MTVKTLIEILLCHNMDENVVLDDNGLLTNNYEIVIPKKEEDTEDDDQEMNELIDDIVNNFNFETVHKYMKLIDWTWYQGNGTYKTPTVPEMKESARTLLADTYREFKKQGETEWNIFNGGFQAIVGSDKDNDVYMKLEFIAENITSYSYHNNK